MNKYQLKIYINTLFIMFFFLALSGCGGDKGTSNGENSQKTSTSTTPVNTTEATTPTSNTAYSDQPTGKTARGGSSVGKPSITFNAPLPPENQTIFKDEAVELIYNIYNSGNAPVKDLKISGHKDNIIRDYNVDKNCGRVLATGKENSCNIKLKVSYPSKEEEYSQSFIISDGDKQLNSRLINLHLIDYEVGSIEYKGEIYVGDKDVFVEIPINNRGNTPIEIIPAKSTSGIRNDIVPAGQRKDIKCSIDTTKAGDISPDCSLLTKDSTTGITTNSSNLPEVKLSIKDKLKFSVKKITDDISAPMEIIAATGLESREIEYLITNEDDSAIINSIKIGDFSDSIKLIEKENRCASNLNLKKGEGCKFKLSVRPRKAGIISQELKVTASSSKGEKRVESSNITMNAVYKTNLLITADMIGNEVTEGRSFSFTSPFTVNELDENSNYANSVFVGTSIGLLKWSLDNDEPTWSKISNGEVIDLFVVGDLVCYVERFCSVSCISGCVNYNYKLNISTEGGKEASWKSLELTGLTNALVVRKVGSKILTLINGNFQEIEILGNNLNLKPYLQDNQDNKFSLFSGSNSSDSLCAISNKDGRPTLFVSNDLGNNWRWYPLSDIYTEHRRSINNTFKVTSVYCSGNRILASTNMASEDVVYEDNKFKKCFLQYNENCEKNSFKIVISENNGDEWQILPGFSLDIDSIYAQEDGIWVATASGHYVFDYNGNVMTSIKRSSCDRCTQVFFNIETLSLEEKEKKEEELKKLKNMVNEKKVNDKQYKMGKETIETIKEILGTLFSRYYKKLYGNKKYEKVFADSKKDEGGITNNKYYGTKYCNNHAQIVALYHPDQNAEIIKNKEIEEYMDSIYDILTKSHETLCKSTKPLVENEMKGDQSVSSNYPQPLLLPSS